MSTYYHVAKDWDGSAIESLALRLGDEAEALDEFCRRWPEADASLGAYHIHYVHLYATRREADDHVSYYGGTVLEIVIDDDMVELDALEFHHPVVRGSIPATCVERLSLID